jgi:hypothetical protein
MQGNDLSFILGVFVCLCMFMIYMCVFCMGIKRAYASACTYVSCMRSLLLSLTKLSTPAGEQ